MTRKRLVSVTWPYRKQNFWRTTLSIFAGSVLIGGFLIFALQPLPAEGYSQKKPSVSKPAVVGMVRYTDTAPDTRFAGVSMPPEHRQMVLETCDAYGVDPELAFAVIWTESRYIATADNGQCVGYMQINVDNTALFARRLGVPNVREPVYNIQCGVSFLGELLRRHGDERLALMYYNEGTAALRKWAAGTRESGYTRRVAAAKEAILNEQKNVGRL